MSDPVATTTHSPDIGRLLVDDLVQSLAALRPDLPHAEILEFAVLMHDRAVAVGAELRRDPPP